jgi:NAD(P)-dependent dehydrogenase (short-subunit alcohol dehydrogenase family)
MELGLKDKVVLVTGASRGIGLAAAKRFAAEGARVAINARGKADLDTAVRELADAGHDVLALPADVSDLAGLPRLVETIHEKWSPVDVLVNNAGAGRYKPFLEVTMEELQHTLNLNFISAYRLTQLIVPHMMKRGGGSIVNVGGISGIQAPKFPLFATASGPMKAAIYNFTKTLATEFGRHNIRANCVIPGLTTSPRFEEMVLKAAGGDPVKLVEEKKKWAKDVMLKDRRWATNEEIGDVIVFVASERASYMTGAGITVDGGIVRAL